MVNAPRNPDQHALTSGQEHALGATVAGARNVHTLRRPNSSPTCRRPRLSVGTAFHPRTSVLNKKLAWGEWAGYFAAAVYADFHDIEYNAIREAAAVIDVSPLFKYLVRGRDATALVDRVITR